MVFMDSILVTSKRILEMLWEKRRVAQCSSYWASWHLQHQMWKQYFTHKTRRPWNIQVINGRQKFKKFYWLDIFRKNSCGRVFQRLWLLGWAFYSLNLIWLVIYFDSIQKFWIFVNFQNRTNNKNQYLLETKQITNIKILRNEYPLWSDNI